MSETAATTPSQSDSEQHNSDQKRMTEHLLALSSFQDVPSDPEVTEAVSGYNSHCSSQTPAASLARQSKVRELQSKLRLVGSVSNVTPNLASSSSSNSDLEPSAETHGNVHSDTEYPMALMLSKISQIHQSLELQRFLQGRRANVRPPPQAPREERPSEGLHWGPNSESSSNSSSAYEPSPTQVTFAPQSTPNDQIDAPLTASEHRQGVLADPAFWADATQEISTLGHKEWVDSEIMDRFLLQSWAAAKDAAPPILYASIRLVMRCTQRDPLSIEETTNARAALFMTEGTATDPRPLAFVFFDARSRHYFFCVFDYQRLYAFTWGRAFNKAGHEKGKWRNGPWRDGPRVWERLALVLGRHGTPDPIAWRGFNWLQNGHDCGPEAAELAIYTFDRGPPLSRDTWPKKPKLACPHHTRLRMLREVAAGIDTSIHFYKHHSGDDHRDWNSAWILDEHMEAMNAGLVSGREYQTLEFELVQGRKKCIVCMERIKLQAQKYREGPGGESCNHHETQDCPMPMPGDEPGEHVLENHGVAPRVPVTGCRQRYPKDGPGKCPKGSPLEGAVCRATSKLRRPRLTSSGWYIHTPLIPVDPRPFQIVREGRNDFDDFGHGPSHESWKEFADQYMSFPDQQLSWDWQPTGRSVYELYADHGYRIEREFALMFVDDMPQKVQEHALPCVDIDMETHIDEDNVVTMGMKSMLRLAGSVPGTPQSIMTFVQGKTPEGKHIRLDPTLDMEIVPSKYIKFSIDIDSVIITSHRLHITADGTLEVDVLPNGRHEAPMNKSNHTYVQVLPPRGQDEIDGDPHRRSSWWSLTVSVASLPHTRFGKVGPFEIIIVFPRMKHKNPLTKRNATIIPHEIHSLFLDRVVYPAIRWAEGKERDSYNNYRSAEWRWKASLHSSFSGKRKTAMVQNVEDLQKAMHLILNEICQTDEMFCAFKSFFFVMEAKGIKAMTHSVIGNDTPDPYQHLKAQFPFLNFDELQKRENGQMVMDLGMSFHPSRPGDNRDPLVGMWDLKHVCASYEAAGMNKASLYPTNTMPMYGGCQAEMSKTRASLVHLIFRSTYNLSYEAVRRIRGGHDSLCQDSDAYQINDKFGRCIDEYDMMLKAAEQKDHSHGCREELRGSGAAICEILQSAGSLMQKYCDNQTMIWVPSQTFFAFAQRRLLDLAATQRELARARPSNYGLTTTIMMHLIRSVCHAPDVRLPHLQRAFIALHFEGNSSRFGMFFLHSLDFHGGFIDEIEPADDKACTAYYEKNVKAAKRKTVPIPNRLQYVDPADFPLGKTPSWAEWQQGIAQDPSRMVRSWDQDILWEESLPDLSVSLFVRFTREYISSLRAEMLMAGPPPVGDLNDAMKIWTIRGMARVVLNPFFTPSSCDVTGKVPGAKEKAFRDQVENFFPLYRPGLKKSVWSPFLKVGYLHRYHRIRREEGTDPRVVQKGLADIFNQLQCLPIVVPGKQLWKVSGAGGILFSVNSKYFKFEGVGKAKSAPKAPRAKATSAVIEQNIRRLYGQSGPSREEARTALAERKAVQKVNAARNARSGAAKNARAPPARRGGTEKNAPAPAIVEPVRQKKSQPGKTSQHRKDLPYREHDMGVVSFTEEGLGSHVEEAEDDEHKECAREGLFGSEAGDDEHGSGMDEEYNDSSMEEVDATYAHSQHEYSSDNSTGSC